ncbi:hypothetical protein BD309DRAFT_975732 [Dichomitus squalens]|nr:hypothetical protein BD309DRAFT_975732 [Dichomitus squalens]
MATSPWKTMMMTTSETTSLQITTKTVTTKTTLGTNQDGLVLASAILIFALCLSSASC